MFQACLETAHASLQFQELSILFWKSHPWSQLPSAKAFWTSQNRREGILGHGCVFHCLIKKFSDLLNQKQSHSIGVNDTGQKELDLRSLTCRGQWQIGLLPAAPPTPSISGSDDNNINKQTFRGLHSLNGTAYTESKSHTYLCTSINTTITHPVARSKNLRILTFVFIYIQHNAIHLALSLKYHWTHLLLSIVPF